MTIGLRAQVQLLVSRSQAILAESFRLELVRAIVCCEIAKRKDLGLEAFGYLMVAEATSVRFEKLHLQGKIFDSAEILELMGELEGALAGHPNQPRLCNEAEA